VTFSPLRRSARLWSGLASQFAWPRIPTMPTSFAKLGSRLSTGPDFEKIFADNPALRTCLGTGDIQKMFKELAPILIRDFPQHFAGKIRVVDVWKPNVILATPVEGAEVAAIAGAAVFHQSAPLSK